MTHSELADELERHPFLEGLSHAHLRSLAGCALHACFPAGNYLSREGARVSSFFLINTGHVAVEIHSASKGVVPIQTLGAGEILGWSWLIPPYQWQFDARAIDDVEAFVLDARALRERCESHHDLGYQILLRLVRVMTERLTVARVQLLDLYE